MGRQTMPEKTEGVTVQKIKNLISTLNGKFILIAKNNVIVSKWCTWEIGIVDSFKWCGEKVPYSR